MFWRLWKRWDRPAGTFLAAKWMFSRKISPHYGSCVTPLVSAAVWMLSRYPSRRSVANLATYRDTAAGSIGQMAATSFYPTKNLGAMGDGGAILTGDDDLAARARCLRDYGQSGKYQHTEIGYNSRLDELQAALLRRVHLPRLGRWTERRREVAARYSTGIRHNGIRLMGSPRDSNSCWHLFPVRVDAERKQDFLAWLKSRCVAAGEHYPILIPDQA